jgi:CheY-like chemotaxis protein
MKKRVLDVGNCNMDHSSISKVLASGFQAEVVRAHTFSEAIGAVDQQVFDLVLVNRQLDRDGSSGLAVIEEIKRRPETSGMPVMMITNFADHQQKAIASGAEPGFGKKDLHSAETHEKLAKFLGG